MAISSAPPRLRRAAREDAAALVRLRAVMFEAMGVPTGDPDDPWRLAALDWFSNQLESPASFAAFVTEDPVLGVVSAACGVCDHRAPEPRSVSGVRGHVFNIATDPRRRRRGYAQACLTSLLAWFSSETSAEIVDLAATSQGSGLYTNLGFHERDSPTMRLVLSESRSRGEPTKAGR